MREGRMKMFTHPQTGSYDNSVAHYKPMSSCFLALQCSIIVCYFELLILKWGYKIPYNILDIVE